MNIAVTSFPVSDSASHLVTGLCASPFSTLGLHPHPTGKGLVVRAWRPDAVAVDVLDYGSGKMLGTMEKRPDGVHELHLTRRRKLFLYQLVVHWENGHCFTLFDPYQFGQYTLKQGDIDSESLHHHLGAQVMSHSVNTRRQIEGVLFKVYAPNARAVHVVGSFNGWDARLHPMASADDGVWRLFIPGLKSGDQYKYAIRDQQGHHLPLKTDPFARRIEQWPGLASVVQGTKAFQWKDGDWLARRRERQPGNQPMSIYEVHAGSWRRKDDGGFLSFSELAGELIPYVQEMGFTHIELLPISEHPLFDSWGYQPVGLFASSSRYGGPDEFRMFVEQCHQAGIGVILDWVPAHFPNDDHGLVNFDGSCLFEHPDPSRGWHPDWQTCIYDFGKPWVQNFLISNALYWLDEYHIDGLRVDAVASMLYLDYSRNDGDWEPNVHGGNENLEAVTFLKKFNEAVHRRFPDVMTIAEESTSWPGVTRTLNEDGLGFDFKWNMGWMNDSLEYMKQDPVHRSWHHDKITFSTVYAWSEQFILPLSHDEVVHGKGTLLTRMPGDEWQKFANLRAYLAFMYAHPGKKLLFMGGELGTHREWNQNASLDWHLLDGDSDGKGSDGKGSDGKKSLNAGVQTLVKGLNQLHRNLPALYQKDRCPEGFAWTVGDDSSQSVLAFRRYDEEGRAVHVVCNLTPVVRHDYRIGVSAAGAYRALLNTDDERFGGSGVRTGEALQADDIAMHGQPCSLSLTLPPLATVILAGE